MPVKVEAYHGGRTWCARGLRGDFFTQGKTLGELLRNAKQAATLHFEDGLAPGEPLSLLPRGPDALSR